MNGLKECNSTMFHDKLEHKNIPVSVVKIDKQQRAQRSRMVRKEVCD